MRLPIFPVLGTLLFVAVFSPFVLMLAGVALTGRPDAAQVGLYLLLNVNPVAIPSLLLLLGVAWVFQRWTALPVASMSAAAPMPRTADRPSRPAVASPAERSTTPRDVVIDVVAVRTEARSPQRAPLPDTRRALPRRAPCLQLEVATTARIKALGMTAR